MRVSQWVAVLCSGLFHLCVAALPADPAPIIPPDLTAYSALPTITDPVLSQSGRYFAFQANIDARRMVVVVESGGGVIHQIDFGDIKLRSLMWAGDDYVLAISSSTQNLGMFYGGRYELFNFLVIDVATGETRWPIQAASTRVLNAAFGFYPPNRWRGKWQQCVNTLALDRSQFGTKLYIRDGDLDLACFDLASGKLRFAAKGGQTTDGWLMSPSGEILATAYRDSARQQWSLKRGKGVSVFSDKDMLAEHDSRYGADGIIGLGREPGTVLYTVSDTEQATHYREARLDGSAEPVAVFDDRDIAEVVFDRHTQLLSGYRVSGISPSLEMLSDADQARVVGAQKAFPGSQVNFVSMSQNLDRMIVLTESNTDSGTWWLVDIAKGSAEILGNSYPGVRSSQVGGFSSWRYHASDGLPIEAVLTEPPSVADGPLPLVVIPHGGPEAHDKLGFDWLAQAFASRGYLVLQPNFRGSSGYGAEFRNSGFGQWGRKMQSDLSDGVAALVEAGRVDPARVCIVGASYGGYAALAGVTLQRGIYRCAVSIAGVSDPAALLREREVERQHNSMRYWRDYLGVSTSFDGDLDSISPLAKAREATAPVLLIHGKDDLVVSISHSRRMAKALARAGKAHRLVELPGEDHFLSRSHTRRRALEEAVSFVMQHNPPQL
ncbi:prolyl oligopeptidase family serine peptidase [Spongiibacter taiwanensis]|uniref:alpha/beta hydrolase family protein n=1 Tax=Spongiibacter taiwanensis TaxID=1748242 RepID=UPI002034EA30|nr:prolyl oligopeptidase family serine peptidase [Spongiibacter taiwanensis]USA41932.1 prolyl oligopeptidase family serine peptidase [Spongiibacter taiwanensis]